MDTIDFIGFHPTTSLRKLAQNRLATLLKAAPNIIRHDGYIILSQEGVFEGSLKLQSAEIHFKAHAKAHDPRQVLQELYKRVKKQIFDWNLKHVTFMPVSIKHRHRGFNPGNDSTPMAVAC